MNVLLKGIHQKHLSMVKLQNDTEVKYSMCNLHMCYGCLTSRIEVSGKSCFHLCIDRILFVKKTSHLIRRVFVLLVKLLDTCSDNLGQRNTLNWIHFYRQPLIMSTKSNLSAPWRKLTKIFIVLIIIYLSKREKIMKAFPLSASFLANLSWNVWMCSFEYYFDDKLHNIMLGHQKCTAEWD